MIETPRAALLADEIAEVADFFSFGTNDLTQMTFGFSRDDVEGRMMAAYLSQGLLSANPFGTSTSPRGASWFGSPSSAGGPARPGLKNRRLRRARWRPGLDRLLSRGQASTTSAAHRSGLPVARLAAAHALRRSTRRSGRKPRRSERSAPTKSNRRPQARPRTSRRYGPSDGDSRRGRGGGPRRDRPSSP